MKKVGLTLGKYAPFHKGHQLVFDTALAETDELVVLIYDTDVISVPLHIRANWIRTLYPKVTVIEGWKGPVGYSNDRAYEILEEQYILKMLDGRKITHFYCSEPYGDHVSKALNALDRRIDEKRNTLPISATLIRDNPFKFRQYLSDVVYKDLITKVVFLGAMSTGKSTLTEALAKKHNTSFAREYGREYWEKNQVDRRISFAAFDEIARIHREREDEATLAANKYVFIDTNAITTYIYSLDYHGKASEYLTQLALENAKRYDLFFLCADDIPYDDTWDRSGEQKRDVFHKQIIADLKERNIPYINLKGSVPDRIKKVETILAQYSKYNNFFGTPF